MTVKAGDRIKFFSEKRPYCVRAADRRYAICTKPFNLKHTTIYTIIDFKEDVRGPDNVIFGLGYETDADAARALAQLQAGEIEVSYRRRIPLDIERVIPAD